MEPTEVNNFAADTVCAISTPPGVGGIAVTRVSGPRAIDCVAKIWRGKDLSQVASHTAHLGEILDSDGNPLDQAVATLYRAPRSFTGDDVVEISTHGSRYIQREIIQSLIAAGCRLAHPGEFTRRAFAAGKMDLAEAEAVADVIASDSRAAHRIALNQMKGGFSKRLASLRNDLVDLVALMELELDFSEEDVEFASRRRLLDIASSIHAEVSRLHRSFASGAAIKEGIPVAIIGDTNAGKSSLLNAILGDDRAIVSDIHGTTRDTIEETIEVGDYRFRFIDTAGIRDTADTIEQIGISRSVDAMHKARIILMVTDSAAPLNRQLLSQVVEAIRLNGAYAIVVANKTDLLTPLQSADRIDEIAHAVSGSERISILPISASTGEGIETLKQQLAGIIDRDTAADDILVTNMRHAEALQHASASIARVIDGLKADIPGDLVSQDIRETLHHLAIITGDIPSTEILTTIFSRFCIGK